MRVGGKRVVTEQSKAEAECLQPVDIKKSKNP